MNYPLSRPLPAYAVGRPALSSAHEDFAALIRHYPDLSDREMAKLHDSFSRLRALDLSLMLHDEDLASRIEVYCSVYGRQHNLPMSGYAMILSLIAVVVVMALVGGAS